MGICATKQSKLKKSQQQANQPSPFVEQQLIDQQQQLPAEIIVSVHSSLNEGKQVLSKAQYPLSPLSKKQTEEKLAGNPQSEQTLQQFQGKASDIVDKNSAGIIQEEKSLEAAPAQLVEHAALPDSNNKEREEEEDQEKEQFYVQLRLAVGAEAAAAAAARRESLSNEALEVLQAEGGVDGCDQDNVQASPSAKRIVSARDIAEHSYNGNVQPSSETHIWKREDNLTSETATATNNHFPKQKKQMILSTHESGIVLKVLEPTEEGGSAIDLFDVHEINEGQQKNEDNHFDKENLSEDGEGLAQKNEQFSKMSDRFIGNKQA